jgi:lipoprotein Spr
MRKSLTLIIFLSVAAVFINIACARAVYKPGKPILAGINFNTDSVSADNLLQFAQSLLGTPYRPGSSDPSRGFDCSGFVSYVFKNFNFNVPRSSTEFAAVGENIKLEDAKPGDIILFTGTKTYHRHQIGHVGIVYSNSGDEVKFIHSTSGKEYCVTISTMDYIYKRRFVKVVRLLKQNDSAPVVLAQAGL